MLRWSSENELLLLQDSFSLASSAEKYLVSVKYDSLKKFSSGSLLLSNSRFSESYGLNFRVLNVLLEGKKGKEVPESSRLELLERSFQKTILLSQMQKTKPVGR